MNNLSRACHVAAISGLDLYKVGLNLSVFTLTPFIKFVLIVGFTQIQELRKV